MSSKKSSKSKKEEALAFLDDLDNFGGPPPTSTGTTTSTGADQPSSRVAGADSPRPERPTTPSSRPKGSLDTSRVKETESVPRKSTSSAQEDKEASEALAFLEAQIEKGKSSRKSGGPLTSSSKVRQGSGSRTPKDGASLSSSTVLSAPTATRKSAEGSRPVTPVNVPSTTPTSSFTNKALADAATGETAPPSATWGSSWWSAASAAVQQARTVAGTVADEASKRAQEAASQISSAAQGERLGAVDADGLPIGTTSGEGGEIKLPHIPGLGQLSDLVGKTKLDGLKGSLDQLRHAGAGALKGVDLEKLRHDIIQRGQSAVTDILNAVAPPISEHEVLQVWLSHDMKGYDGVESVVYSAVSKIMEQTTFSDLEVFYSSPPKSIKEEENTSRSSSDDDEPRSINPVKGWEQAQEKTLRMLKEVVDRAALDPRKGQPHLDLPVTTIPVYLHLQPAIVPLPYNFKPATTANAKSPQAETHLAFIVALEDPTHSLSRSTVTQYVPGDWLDVEYERSDWVEERLVEVINNGVEIAVQEYVATRMGLKAGPSSDQTDNEEKDQTASGAKPTSTNEKVALEPVVGAGTA